MVERPGDAIARDLASSDLATDLSGDLVSNG
jgi:hypothetical protein